MKKTSWSRVFLHFSAEKFGHKSAKTSSLKMCVKIGIFGTKSFEKMFPLETPRKK
jgi:hypothetical protein